jgi:uncharacterized repeat protein (TIGR03943 family)
MSTSHRTQRTFQALILAATGLFLLERIWSGTLFWYINQRFLVLVLAAGIGLLALAQSLLPRRNRQTQPEAAAADHDHHEPHEHEHDPHAGHGHSHALFSPWTLLLVALPVILGVLVPARPLGSTAIANKGLNAAAPLVAGNGGQPVKLDLAPTDRNILDWVRAFNYEADPAVFNSQPADVIGFVFHDSRLGDGQFFAGRFAVSCCVADATGIAVIVQWPESADLADNSWVRVRGAVQVAQLEGKPLPLIVADSVESVPEPDQPYLYP